MIITLTFEGKPFGRPINDLHESDLLWFIKSQMELGRTVHIAPEEGGLMGERCAGYVGLACVDGSCPAIDHDEMGGYIHPIVENCKECYLYKSCMDCAMRDTGSVDKVIVCSKENGCRQ